MNNLLKNTEKDQFWQGIRGIAIIAVVLIHCKMGLGYIQGTDALSKFNFSYWFILRNIITFAVAVFLFMSGYFVNIEKAIKEPGAFIKKRFIRLIIPYAVWSFIYFIWNGRNGVFKIGSFVNNFFTGVDTHLYYILVLLQFVIITPLLAKWAVNNKKWIFIITPLWTIAEYYSRFKFGHDVPHDSVLIFPWIIFYYLGLTLKAKNGVFKKNVKLSAVLFFGAMVINILESFLMYKSGMNIELAILHRRAGAMIYVLAIVNLLFNIKECVKMPKWLIKAGDYSFFIYLSHVIALNIVGMVLERTPIICNILPVYHIISVLFALTACIFADRVLIKVIGSKRAQKYFGG